MRRHFIKHQSESRLTAERAAAATPATAAAATTATAGAAATAH